MIKVNNLAEMLNSLDKLNEATREFNKISAKYVRLKSFTYAFSIAFSLAYAALVTWMLAKHKI